MIKLTYAQLNNPGFSDAIARLAQKDGFASARVSYNVSRIYRQISVKLKEARAEFGAFAEPFTLKDEKGKPVPAEQPAAFPFQIIPEKNDDFEKQTVEFFNTETTIESYPLSIDDLGSVEISPADIMALGPIIVGVSSIAEVPQGAGLTIVPEQSPSH